MKSVVVATALALLPVTAQAHSHHHVRHHRHHVARHHHQHYASNSGGIVTKETDAGPIRVAAAYADRFVGFINDLVKAGYKPKDIGCFSPTGHMANSKHHVGKACDIDQRARNKTAAKMYHVAELAHEHGLTDGCTWHNPDCGHVEVPGPNPGGHYATRRHIHVASRRTHYAAYR